MFRTIPTGNKICSTKETLQNQQILVNHLTNMRPQIDTKAPQKFASSNRIKNEKFRLVKQNEIDRENHHLLNKITGIMQSSQSQSHSSLMSYKKSLNSNHRKNELIKIVVDNQALLKRIQDQRSKYDIKLWDHERKDIEKQIANICEYPFKDYKPNKTLVQFWNTSKLSESQLAKKDIPKKLEPISRTSQLKSNVDYQDCQTEFPNDQVCINQILDHTKISSHTSIQQDEIANSDAHEAKKETIDNLKLEMIESDDNKTPEKKIEVSPEIENQMSQQIEVEDQKEQISNGIEEGSVDD